MKKFVLVLLFIFLIASPCLAQEQPCADQDASSDVTIEEQPDIDVGPSQDISVEADNSDAKAESDADAITLDSKDVNKTDKDQYPILFKMYAQKVDVPVPETASSDSLYTLNNGSRLKLNFENNSSNYFSDKNTMFRTADIAFDSQSNDRVNYNVNIQARNINNYDSETTSKVYSYLYSNIDKNNTLYVGNTMLSDSSVADLSFISQNEYRDNIGAKISGKGNHIDYVAGVYNSPDTGSVASGVVASSKELQISPKAGSLRFGSGYYSQGNNEDAQNTLGLFSVYKINSRFKLKSEVARNKYVSSDNYTDSVFITPELNLTKNLTVKTKYSKDVASEYYVNDFIVDYSLPGKKNWKISNIKLEFDASYVKQPDTDYYQRFKFVTKYNF